MADAASAEFKPATPSLSLLTLLMLDKPYNLCSIGWCPFIIHKGVYSTSGHYQAATVHEDRLWLHDDGSKPKLQHDAENTFCNTYLLCYQALPVAEAR